MRKWKVRSAVAGAAAIICAASPASAAEAAQQASLDHVWTMIAAALVLFMQAGFLLLEAGFVRSKNSINVAQKNIADLILSISMFWLIGFAVMFGPSLGALGWSWDLAGFSEAEDWSYTFFVFQAVFCGTAATIMSGAVAERMSFSAYLVLTVAISVLIYPVFGHWAWGNLLDGDNAAWLADAGFIDFAGSTVVHSIGAWVALAAIVVLGPRIGRFDAAGRPVEIQGHSPVLSAAGAIILFVGWIGFNGGSTTAGTPAFAHIVANTVIAGALGGVGALIYGRFFDSVLKPDRAINGLLGGLVAITAGCDVVDAGGAAWLGLMGGFVAVAAQDAMARHLKLDDVVGAVAVHGVAGAFGTVALVFFASEGALAGGSVWSQLWIQLQGVGLGFLWAFGLAYGVLKLASLVIELRVSAEDEFQGLNRAEHGATLGAGHLQAALIDLLKGDADFRARIAVEPGDEAAELTELFNELLARLERDATTARAEDAARRMRLEAEAEADRAVVAEISELIARASDGDLTGRLSLTQKTGLLRSVSAGVNKLVDVMDGVSTELKDALGAMAEGDLSRRLSVSGGGAFAALGRDYNASLDALSTSIGGVRAGASELGEMSGGLLRSAESMAEAATTQARVAEESSEAMNAAAASLSQSRAASIASASDAAAASALAADGAQDAERAHAEMARLDAAMERAEAIVGVIDAISRQTNMVAINAAVEAARAGAAGEQFAVVADEVRRLSTRVAEAAHEVSTIITENASLSRAARERVAAIKGALGRIEKGSALVKDSIAEMADRLAEDAERLERVTRCMGELSESASATARQSSGADREARRLAHCAASLRSLAERYQLAPDGEDGKAAA